MKSGDCACLRAFQFQPEPEAFGQASCQDQSETRGCCALDTIPALKVFSC